ncbi:MAG: hypothetical protein IT429_20565 [Gemmataceae bacterium]|nr:hypothetical protein [Gemmataceae bacterium]
MRRLRRAAALGLALWTVAAATTAAAPLTGASFRAAQAGADAPLAPTAPAALPTVIEAARAALADPNVAFLLLLVGAVGLIAEVYHPGSFVPGIVGIVAIILGVVALGSLPTNWGAVGLLLFALLLFLLEVHLPSHGVLGAGAVVAFLLGGLLLFSSSADAPPAVVVEVNRWLLLASAATCTGFFLVLVRLVLRARRLPIADPLARLVGSAGVTASALDPSGSVRVLSESWSAVSVGAPIPAGARVEVVARDGLTLQVRRLSPILVGSGEALASQGEVRPGVQVVRGERVG